MDTKKLSDKDGKVSFYSEEPKKIIWSIGAGASLSRLCISFVVKSFVQPIDGRLMGLHKEHSEMFYLYLVKIGFFVTTH